MVTRLVSKGTRVLWETVLSPAGKESVDRWNEFPRLLADRGFLVCTNLGSMRGISELMATSVA